MITEARKTLLHNRIDRQARKVKLELERLVAIVPGEFDHRLVWMEGVVDSVRNELRAEAAPHRSKGATS